MVNITVNSFINLKKLYIVFNSLTPVPPVTTRDEPWPFFLFWRHHFWPKLALSILNFCRRKLKIFPMMPRSEWSAQKSLAYAHKCSKSWVKTQSKISCHYTWLLHSKNCPSRWHFLRGFLTSGKPSRRSITAGSEKEEKRRKRKGEKKFQKSKSLKT